LEPREKERRTWRAHAVPVSNTTLVMLAARCMLNWNCRPVLQVVCPLHISAKNCDKVQTACMELRQERARNKSTSWSHDLFSSSLMPLERPDTPALVLPYSPSLGLPLISSFTNAKSQTARAIWSRHYLILVLISVLLHHATFQGCSSG